MGGAEAQTAVAVARRQVAQSIFCNRRNQGQGQNGYGQSTGHEVPLGTGHDDEDQVTEQADDDRRQGCQGFNSHADPMGNASFFRVFSQEDTCRNTDNRTGNQG